MATPKAYELASVDESDSDIDRLFAQEGGRTDTYFKSQWHIRNRGLFGGGAGEDANVVPVWSRGNFGQDVVISVVDDGLEITHPDLANSVLPGLSYNYVNGSDDPSGPRAMHGTCVGGIIAGHTGNGVGVAGVAPKAKIVALNFLESNVTVTEVDAMTRNIDKVSVSNNSWGPGPIAHGLFRPASSAWQEAIKSGLTNGRDGKGIVYVFAAGNGALSAQGDPADNSNLSGYANFYGVTTVCAVDHRGKNAIYSEPGANLWVCAPSGSGNRRDPAVATTDLSGPGLGYNSRATGFDLPDRSYTRMFSGTSAATPQVSGVVALMLHERPELTWRDVKWILARSARKNDSESPGWEQNGANPPLHIHYDYGFGVVDAAAAVELAQTWTLVGPMQTVAAPADAPQPVALPIADNGTPVTSAINVSNSGITKLEYVEVTVNLEHGDWGDLAIQLERSGQYTTTSVLAIKHRCLAFDESETPCAVSGNTFRFGSARHLGEAADGTWTLRVIDQTANNQKGTLTNWQLRFFGE